MLKYLLPALFPFAVHAQEAQTPNWHAMPSEKAYPLLEQAVEKNPEDAEALFQLSRYYSKGVEVERDEEKAIALLKSAAAKGHAEAQYNLSAMYWQGTNGIEKNTETAVALLTSAAEAGFTPARIMLGSMYLVGKGVAEDEARGKALIEAAAQSDNPSAQFMLATLSYHLKPSYTAQEEQDLKTSEAWLLKAAKQKHILAMGFLFTIYLEGPETIKNPEDAYYWAVAMEETTKELPASYQQSGEIKDLLIKINQVHSWLPKNIGEAKAEQVKQRAIAWVKANQMLPTLQ